MIQFELNCTRLISVSQTSDWYLSQSELRSALCSDTAGIMLVVIAMGLGGAGSSAVCLWAPARRPARNTPAARLSPAPSASAHPPHQDGSVWPALGRAPEQTRLSQHLEMLAHRRLSQGQSLHKRVCRARLAAGEELHNPKACRMAQGHGSYGRAGHHRVPAASWRGVAFAC
jgi:hypothetical protein